MLKKFELTLVSKNDVHQRRQLLSGLSPYVAFEKTYGDMLFFIHIYSYPYDYIKPGYDLFKALNGCMMLMKNGKSIDFEQNQTEELERNIKTIMNKHTNLKFLESMYNGRKEKFIDSIELKTVANILELLESTVPAKSQRPVQCRRCGIFDEYAPSGPDGKCLCWQCC